MVIDPQKRVLPLTGREVGESDTGEVNGAPCDLHVINGNAHRAEKRRVQTGSLSVVLCFISYHAMCLSLMDLCSSAYCTC